MRVGRTPSVARSWLLGADVHVWATWAGVRAGIDVAELVQQGW